jgi:prepilin-type N-terminal cleavage/methylation domain-containing protein
MDSPNRRKRTQSNGFTLCELLIVLMIMTTALTLVVPYVTRSNSGLKTDELCQDMASAAEYAVDYAVHAATPVRLVISPSSRCFQLEQAEDISGETYTSIDGTPGQTRFFDDRLHITDIDGFDVLGTDRYVLVFDPRKPWPRAEIAIASDSVARRIYIRGPLADVQQIDL